MVDSIVGFPPTVAFRVSIIYFLYTTTITYNYIMDRTFCNSIECRKQNMEVQKVLLLKCGSYRPISTVTYSTMKGVFENTLKPLLFNGKI